MSPETFMPIFALLFTLAFGGMLLACKRYDEKHARKDKFFVSRG